MHTIGLVHGGLLEGDLRGCFRIEPAGEIWGFLLDQGCCILIAAQKPIVALIEIRGGGGGRGVGGGKFPCGWFRKISAWFTKRERRERMRRPPDSVGAPFWVSY